MFKSRTSRLTARDLALVAAFAALICVLSQGAIYPFGNTVPITLQSLGVMLAGALLGWKRGALAVLTWLVLGAAGLPVFAGGTSGLAKFVGPTGGYLFGFLVGVVVIGWLVERAAPGYTPVRGFFANVAGLVAIYACGIPVTAMVVHTKTIWAIAQSTTTFLPGDLIKAVVVAGVAAAVHRAMPELLVGSPRRAADLPERILAP